MDHTDFQNLMKALHFTPTPYQKYNNYEQFMNLLRDPTNIDNITVSTVKLCIKYKINSIDQLPIIHFIVRSALPRVLYVYLKEGSSKNTKYNLFYDFNVTKANKYKYVQIIKILENFNIALPQIDTHTIHYHDDQFINWLKKKKYIGSHQKINTIYFNIFRCGYSYLWGMNACRNRTGRFSNSDLVSDITEFFISLLILFHYSKQPHFIGNLFTTSRHDVVYIPWLLKFIFPIVSNDRLSVITAPLSIVSYILLNRLETSYLPTYFLLLGALQQVIKKSSV